MGLSKDTRSKVALFNLILASVFCFVSVWVLTLANSDTNLFESISKGFSMSLGEMRSSKRYLTNLFFLPLIYGFLIITILLVYSFALDRDRLKKIVFSVFGLGVFFSVISLTYADGTSFVLIATIIVFFSVIAIRKSNLSN